MNSNYNNMGKHKQLLYKSWTIILMEYRRIGHKEIKRGTCFPKKREVVASPRIERGPRASETLILSIVLRGQVNVLMR